MQQRLKKIVTSKILSAFLAALMLFSALGLSSQSQAVNAETEAVSATKTEAEYKTEIDQIKADITTAFGSASGNWTESGNYDTSWYDNHTTDAVYTLNTAAQVAGMAVKITSGVNFSGKTIKLGANIDLDAHFWVPAGGVQNSRYFSGTFDGNGFSIVNMKINQQELTTSNNYIGFFAMNSGTVKNTNFDNPLIIAMLGVENYMAK